MSVEATAAALAPEPAIQEQPHEVTTSVEDEMAAIWDKHNTEEPEKDDPTPNEPEEKVEAADKPSEEPEIAEQKAEIPSDIPRQLRTHWGNLSEDARRDVEDFARETNRKLSEQGRLVQGISPIRDSLVEATKQFPHLADMKPQDVAQEVFQLARISQDFASKPVETLLGLAQKHGITEHLRQAMSGQKQEAPLQAAETIRKQQQTIEQLQRKVEQFADPEYIRSQVTAVTTEQMTANEVQNFASTAEHWDKVEETIPELIPAVKARMPDAPPKDVLKAAYDLAVSWVVPTESKAPDEATEQVAKATDPEKAKAILKAKSVNVTGGPSKPRQLTQQESDEAIYDKYFK